MSKYIIKSILISWLILYNCSGYNKQNLNKTKPNIIFILADDLGFSDLPNYGNSFNEAKNLNKLAQEGMQFSNAYAASPVCSPSRASIQTGIYPARIGINDFLPGHWRPYEELVVPINKTQYLPTNYKTIGEALQEEGYRTAYFGKWHLGFNEKYYPKNQGYDESVVYNGGGFFDFNHNMIPPTNYPKGTILSQGLTNLSLDFIEKNKNDPFFLFLSHYDVHVQLEAQDSLIQKYLDKPKAKDYPSNAVYAAMVENIDTSVGEIMDKLESLNLSDNTIIVFFSDNGGLIKRYDETPLISNRNLHFYQGDSMQYVASSNKPLRSEKGTVFEGGIREPLIVKWPGKVAPGSTSEALVSGLDIFPTFLEMANTQQVPTSIDGKSIVPELMSNSNKKERVLFWHYPVYHHDTPASAVRRGDWKLIHFFEDNHLELYNLKEDIGESRNLVNQDPEIADELFELLEKWRKDVEAALPTKNPNFDVSRRLEWSKHPSLDKIIEEIHKYNNK